MSFSEDNIRRKPDGKFTHHDQFRAEQGQLDFGDGPWNERAEKAASEDDGRDIVTDEYGVQHFPDGGEQHPLI